MENKNFKKIFSSMTSVLLAMSNLLGQAVFHCSAGSESMPSLGESESDVSLVSGLMPSLGESGRVELLKKEIIEKLRDDIGWIEIIFGGWEKRLGEIVERNKRAEKKVEENRNQRKEIEKREIETEKRRAALVKIAKESKIKLSDVKVRFAEKELFRVCFADREEYERFLTKMKKMECVQEDEYYCFYYDCGKTGWRNRLGCGRADVFLYEPLIFECIKVRESLLKSVLVTKKIVTKHRKREIRYIEGIYDISKLEEILKLVKNRRYNMRNEQDVIDKYGDICKKETDVCDDIFCRLENKAKQLKKDISEKERGALAAQSKFFESLNVFFSKPPKDEARSEFLKELNELRDLCKLRMRLQMGYGMLTSEDTKLVINTVISQLNSIARFLMIGTCPVVDDCFFEGAEEIEEIYSVIQRSQDLLSKRKKIDYDFLKKINILSDLKENHELLEKSEWLESDSMKEEDQLSSTKKTDKKIKKLPSTKKKTGKKRKKSKEIDSKEEEKIKKTKEIEKEERKRRELSEELFDLEEGEFVENEEFDSEEEEMSVIDFFFGETLEQVHQNIREKCAKAQPCIIKVGDKEIRRADDILKEAMENAHEISGSNLIFNLGDCEICKSDIRHMPRTQRKCDIPDNTNIYVRVHKDKFDPEKSVYRVYYEKDSEIYYLANGIDGFVWILDPNKAFAKKDGNPFAWGRLKQQADSHFYVPEECKELIESLLPSNTPSESQKIVDFFGFW